MSSNSGRARTRTVRSFLDMKRDGDPIAMLTASDALMAGYLERAGVDLILVGDSLGMTKLGYETTVPVTLDDMLHHGKAVRRGAPASFLVLDLPFLSYQISAEQAVQSAGRALKETGVQAVKMEGGGASIVEAVRRVSDAGIPVMGHVGLTPQAVHRIGGYRVQGRDGDGAERITEQAQQLEEAGCFALVLELVPADLARRITGQLEIPTIGIGAGAGCDGQVLVTVDALGIHRGFEPRFLRRFAEVGSAMEEGLSAYISAVKDGSFPGPEHEYPSRP